jgi:ferritin-like metal-binding protein YciE
MHNTAISHAQPNFGAVDRCTSRKEIPMPQLGSLDDLLVHELQRIYHAEVQVLEVLPRMVTAATHADLKEILEAHRQQSERQVGRLERAFMVLGVPGKRRTCDGMAGLLKEAKQVLDQDAGSRVMDVALIAAAQKVAHYEIAAYGTVCTYAEILGYDQVHELLGQNLDEEETTDQRLAALAETAIQQHGDDLALEDLGAERPA